MGGLPKKATLLSTRKIANEERLLIDSGALLFAKTNITSASRLAQDKIRAQAIIQAYNLMDYDAVGIGRRDLAGGLPFLQKLAETATFPLLSANIINEQGEPILSPFTILHKNGLNIGITSITNPAGSLPAPNETFHIDPWQKQLPKIVTELSSKCDMLILLSNLPSIENKAIAAAHPDIHLIFQAGISPSNTAATLENNSLIMQTAKEGKYIGELSINWSKSKIWQKKENSLIAAQKELDRLLWQTGRMERRGDPIEVYKDSPRTLNHYQKLQKRIIELQSSIKKLKTLHKTPEYIPPATYRSKMHAVKISIKEDPQIRILLEENKLLANQSLRNIKNTEHLAAYIGSISCRDCHEQIYTAWRTTRHANAFQTLSKKNQDKNLGCVYCHVTGIDETSATLVASLPSALHGVGCEQCHGPGKKHSQSPNQYKLATTITPQSCLGCHTPDHDDDFDFTRDVELVH